MREGIYVPIDFLIPYGSLMRGDFGHLYFIGRETKTEFN